MTKLTVAIVDDEPLARALIESYVAKTNFLELKGQYSCASAAIRDLTATPVDVVFMDIQMPDLDGMQFSRMIPSRTRVIFTTAFSEYALEGFRVNALDYLKKPIDYSEFLESANKALAWFSKNENATSTSNTKAGNSHPDDFIYVKSDYKHIQVNFDKMLYVEGVKDYLKIYMEDSKPIMTLMSMKSLEERLPSPRFIRIHRSYIVQMPKVESINKGSLTIKGSHLPISEGYKEEIQKYISEHII